jgi:hypothetical protein
VFSSSTVSNPNKTPPEILHPQLLAISLSARSIVDCFSQINKQYEDRFNNHLKKCEAALRAKTPEDAIEAYATSFNLEPDHIVQLGSFVHHNKLSGQNLRYYLIWQTLNQLHLCFIWTIDDWMVLFGKDSTHDAVAQLIDSLSLQIGDLADANPDHFFMANPVWLQPLITIDEDRVIVPTPAMLLSHCLEIIASLIDRNDRLKEKYLNRRGEFLESKLFELVNKALPSAELFPGSIWQEADGTEGENDLLAILNGVALVFEAKAGTVHPTAKRGAPLRLQDTVGKLVVDASSQAYGFSNFLKKSTGPIKLRSSKGGFNEIDPRKIDTYLPVAISLDQLASEFMCWRLLLDTKTVPPDAQPLIATSIWDFELVTKVLDDECLLLHYLTRRYSVEQRALYFGDELDLLVLYLDTALEIPAEATDSPLQIGHLSLQLHPYFIGKEQGFAIEKPRRQLTKWWQSLTAAIWKKQTAENREASYALLDVPIVRQKEIEMEFEKVKNYVRSNSTGAPMQDCLIFETGAGTHRYCVVLMAIGDELFSQPSDELHKYMTGTARKALGMSAASYVMVVAVHVDLTALPYTRFILIHKDAWTAPLRTPSTPN